MSFEQYNLGYATDPQFERTEGIRLLRVMNPVDPQAFKVFAAMALALIELGRFEEAIIAGKKA